MEDEEALEEEEIITTNTNTNIYNTPSAIQVDTPRRHPLANEVTETIIDEIPKDVQVVKLNKVYSKEAEENEILDKDGQLQFPESVAVVDTNFVKEIHFEIPAVEGRENELDVDSQVNAGGSLDSETNNIPLCQNAKDKSLENVEEGVEHCETRHVANVEESVQHSGMAIVADVEKNIQHREMSIMTDVFQLNQELKKAEIKIKQLHDENENRITIAQLEGVIENQRETAVAMSQKLKDKEKELDVCRGNLINLMNIRDTEAARWREYLENKKKELGHLMEKCKQQEESMSKMGRKIQMLAEENFKIREENVKVKKDLKTTVESQEKVCECKNWEDIQSLDGSIVEELNEKCSQLTETITDMRKESQKLLEENTRIRTENVKIKNRLKAGQNQQVVANNCEEEARMHSLWN